jgi:hypothetical protein
MRPMYLDAHIIARLRELAQYAADNPFSIDDLLDIKNGDRSPIELIDEFCCEIPVGYHVCYSEQLHPAGRVSHLAFWVDDMDVLPGDKSALLIMEVLGMPKDFDSCLVKISSRLHDNGYAVNIGYLKEKV